MRREPTPVLERRAAYRRWLAVAGIFTLAAGDFWRYLLSWWGWGAIAGALLVLVIVELVHSRAAARRLPPMLLVTIAVMTLSIAWSAYPAASALGVLTTLATTLFAVFLATCLDGRDLVDALAWALRSVLVLSFLFEFVVAVFLRRPLLPFFVDYSHLESIPRAFYWSRDLLFEGGRIQGIVGNANLLAMVALLALIAGLVRAIGRRESWSAFVAWSLMAVLALGLTRSTTILIAAAVTAVVGAAAWATRRSSGRGRLLLGVGLLALVLTGGLLAVIFRAPLLAWAGKSSDLTNRLDIWSAVIDLAVQRPLEGWGWISYWAPWVEPFDDLAVIRGVTYLQAHNAWLDVFLQLGAVGLVAVGLFALTTLARSWVYALDGPRTDALLPLLLTCALLVQSLAESRLLIEIGWALFVVCGIRTATNRWSPP
jgi:Lipid A core - O-antigen ligase and related enzymes